MKIHLFIGAAISTVLLSACQMEADIINMEELGAKTENISLPCLAGTASVEILSNTEFTLSSDSPWISFENGSSQISGAGDMQIEFSYTQNRKVDRTANLSLSGKEGKKIIINVFQRGMFSADIRMLDKGVLCSRAAQSAQARISTFIPDNEIEFSASESWIEDIRKENNYVIFSVHSNEQDVCRSASITVSARGFSDEFTITQSGADFEMLSLAEFMSIYDTDGSFIHDGNLAIEGIVINDNTEGNAAPNENLSAVTQDFTLSSRTLYLESPDGSCGVKVVLDSPDDNVASRWSNLCLSLKGAKIIRKSEPLRFEIRGVSREDILSCQGGSIYGIPQKLKTIGNLTDNDIYTYVTLENCEIPIRKGPFVPLDLRYLNIISCYPMPIRDIEGSDCFLMSNIDCDWARDGKGLPQGSGNISGIIVHETSDNFVWDVDVQNKALAEGVGMDYIHGIGEISRYQIRPQSKSEIALAEEFSDGFSEMIMEVRYLNNKSDAIVKNMENNIIYPTYPLSADPIHDANINSRLEVIDNGNRTGVLPWRDWTHLGPVANGRITDKTGGNGVYDFNGASAHWYIYDSVQSTGLIYADNGSGWYGTNWHTNKWYQASFSTEGLSTENLPLSVQFGMENGQGEAVGGAKYWTLEYTIDAKNWIKVADFTVPDFPLLNNRKLWQLPGFKYMSFNLPKDSALLNQASVKIRLRPVSDAASTKDSYDGGSINKSIQSAMNYFAIRYNK